MTPTSARHANDVDEAALKTPINSYRDRGSRRTLTDQPLSDIQLRRKRAAYRAHHRGTKEMDWLVGRYADARVGDMNDPELALFEAFLALPDPELQNWIMGDEPVSDPRFAPLVGEVRCFHGLQQSAG
ncbi:MAG: hypothetical protein RLZ98_2004 [Pseudomonadota bacterium]|jgi:antitoxin CptB